jgi:hypothetical protein
VVTLDDATSAVYSGFLVAEEGTASSFRARSEVIAEHGLFCELYTDRGSHYFHTPKAGQAVSKNVQTQSLPPRRRGSGGRWRSSASATSPAYSPEARGRSERAFRTLQDRLPKELALAEITTIAAANRWLAETYWPAHNAGFAVAPAEIGSAFVADRTGRMRDILCIQEERRVGNDNTVKWRRLTLQIPPNPLRPHFLRAVVRIHEYPDGRLAVFHGPQVFHGPIAWPNTMPRDDPMTTPSWLPDPLRPPPCGFIG